MLCLGRANYFRFNNPEQAMKLKGDIRFEEGDSNGQPSGGKYLPNPISPYSAP